MKPLSFGVMALSFAIGLALGALLAGVLLVSAHSPLIVTPWLALLFGFVGLAVLIAGLQVKRLKSGKSTRISYIHAARIAVFARSTAINGSAFTAFLLGVLFVSLTRLWASAVALAALNAGIAAAGALVMTVLAAIAEHWCLDDNDDSAEKRKSKKQESNRHSDGKAHGQA